MVINNNLSIQWGMLPGNKRNAWITYPVAINKNIYMNGHPIYSTITGHHDYDPNFITTSTTQFQIYCDPGGTVHAQYVNWICVGI